MFFNTLFCLFCVFLFLFSVLCVVFLYFSVSPSVLYLSYICRSLLTTATGWKPNCSNQISISINLNLRPEALIEDKNTVQFLQLFSYIKVEFQMNLLFTWLELDKVTIITNNNRNNHHHHHQQQQVQKHVLEHTQRSKTI